MTIPTIGNYYSDKAIPKEFYLLSPDGFTLSCHPKLYTSVEDAKQDYETWSKRLVSQGYYSSPNYGRIPLEDVWNYMILHTMPFFPVNL